MTAQVFAFPGVGDGPGNRPATYEEYLVSIGLAPKTVNVYRKSVEMAERLLNVQGSNLNAATALDLAAMTAQTVNTHSRRGQLRCALKHWYEWQDRFNAPLRAVRVPPQPRMVCQALDALEARSLAEVARHWWPQGGAVLLGLYLALRREEIARAEWERFDERMEWYTVTGKNSKTATIPVHPAVADVFAAKRGAGYIFKGRATSWGKYDHISPATVYAWVRLVGVETGIRGLRTHQLRHTSLTTALDNTENLRAVMEFGRHERPQTTAGYTRTTKEQLRRVSDALAY